MQDPYQLDLPLLFACFKKKNLPLASTERHASCNFKTYQNIPFDTYTFYLAAFAEKESSTIDLL